MVAFLRPFCAKVAALTALTVLHSALAVVPAIAGQRLIDDGVVRGDARTVWLLGAVLVAAGVCQGLLALAAMRFSTALGADMVCALRAEMYAHLLRQSPGFFTWARTGAVVSRLDGDVTGIERVVTTTLPSAVGALVTLTTALAATVVLEWRLALTILILAPAMYLLASWFGKALKTVGRHRMEAQAELNSLVAERLTPGGIELVQLFSEPGREISAFAARSGRARNLAVRHSALEGGAHASMICLMTGTTAAAYVVAGNGVMTGSLSLGTMVALLTLLARLYGPLASLPSLKADIVAGQLSMARVWEVLDFLPLVTDPLHPLDLPARRAQGAHVAISGLSFAYPPKRAAVLESLADSSEQDQGPRTVLKGISIDIPAGTTVAIVGPSGSGKTTLSRLLLRTWDPGAGSIRIDGVDLRDLRLSALRSVIGVVPQEPYLLQGTIRANLLLADPGAGERELLAACRTAQLLPLLARLPEGLDTLVGGRGTRLSGGERQRLSIARLLLQQPRVIVMDEATSHLDPRTERELRHALTHVLHGRTCILIAHRLETVRDADLILVMEEGRVVETGTHDVLARSQGAYAKLLGQGSRPRCGVQGNERRLPC